MFTSSDGISLAFKDFSSKADEIFASYDKTVIQRHKKTGTNIGARYVSQFTLQLLCRNSGGFQGASSELSELLGKIDLEFAASSICDARRKYPAELFSDLNQAFLGVCENYMEKGARLSGRRLFSIDGSKQILPRPLINSGFKPEKKQSHYPTGRLSVLYEIGSKLVYDLSLNSHMNERKAVADHLTHLLVGDIVIYDRGYYSYHLIEEHLERGLDFVFRVPEVSGIKAIDDFVVRNVSKKLSEDYIVLQNPKSDKSFKLRVIKYVYDGKPYILLTSLTDAKVFSLESFPDLYHSRWGIEEAYKQLKVFLLKKKFHSQSLRSIQQELFAAAFLMNVSEFFAATVQNEVTLQKKKKSIDPTKQADTSRAFLLAGKQIIRQLSIHSVFN